jgi:LCP family protein required for cell wall assembly
MQDKKTEELLKQQVLEIMNEEQQEKHQKPKKKKKKHKVLKAIGIVFAILLVAVLFIVGTKPGRRLAYKAVSSFVFGNVNWEDIDSEDGDASDRSKDTNKNTAVRSEKYITNYLIFGIEEFKGAKNTDSMMIATIDTKKNTLKLTSLLRDSYVEIPGYKNNKLNSAYAKGGVKLLMETIEHNYKIDLDGYVSVNFESFEKIVDLLGGVDIELGKKEAEYLNRTNYISKKSNRNVKPGWNHLNGNQVLGYCRVRKVETLGGVSSDYGRILRQQRTLNAIFDSYKSKSFFKLLPIAKECLGYVNTNLTQKQIEDALAAVVENKIRTLETFRVPVDGAFEAPKKYNGIGYPLVLEWDKNRIELYKFIFNYSDSEAQEALASLK